MRNHAFTPDTGTWVDKLFFWWRTKEVLKQIPKDAVVCDLGCGKKANFLFQVPALRHGIGVDMEVDSPDTDKITFVRHDLETVLPLQDSTADAVTSLAVVEHLNNRELHAREARRILKTGGVFLATTPAPKGKYVLELLAFLKFIDRDEIHDHKIYLGKKDLEMLCAEAGFSECKVIPFEFGFNHLVVAKK